MARQLPHVTLGTVVRARRDELDLSQEEIAYRAGIHPTYLSGIERGRRNPSFDVVVAVAEALELQLQELVDRYLDAAA